MWNDTNNYPKSGYFILMTCRTPIRYTFLPIYKHSFKLCLKYNYIIYNIFFFSVFLLVFWGDTTLVRLVPDPFCPVGRQDLLYPSLLEYWSSSCYLEWGPPIPTGGLDGSVGWDGTGVTTQRHTPSNSG